MKVACRSIEEVTSFYVDKLGCELDMKQDPYWAEVKLPGDFRVGFLKSDEVEVGDAWRLGLGSSNLGTLPRLDELDNNPQRKLA